MFGIDAATRSRLLERISTHVARAEARLDLVGADQGPPVVAGMAGWKDFQLQRAAAENLGLPNPFYRNYSGIASRTIVADGREYLNFSNYNYLGLNGHPEVRAAAKAAIDEYGVSASASRMVSGERSVHGELEAAIAGMLGAPQAVVLPSGYLANIVAISSLVGPNDIVVHDALAHHSIIAGAQASGARRLTFRHNDLSNLDAMITRNRQQAKRVLIVVEGLYSMDGDTCPLADLVALKRRHGAILMVDDAHGIGVLGATGRGIGEATGVAPDAVDVWMGTLSKTLASCGGYIAGPVELLDWLRYGAVSGYVFSAAISPPAAAAALAALRIMLREPERVRAVNAIARLFLEKARAAGLSTGTAEGKAIVPVIVGSSIVAGQASVALFENGVNVHPIVYPAVPEQSARLRFFLTADHRPDDVAQAVEAVGRFMNAR
jgi:8-amino-7-oxononanoate synthase